MSIWKSGRTSIAMKDCGLFMITRFIQYKFLILFFFFRYNVFLYIFQVYNGSYEAPYTNPKAPVHFVTGSAGCKEGREDFTDTRPPWSAFISRDYGYTRLKAYNRTHLYWEQVIMIIFIILKLIFLYI